MGVSRMTAMIIASRDDIRIDQTTANGKHGFVICFGGEPDGPPYHRLLTADTVFASLEEAAIQANDLIDQCRSVIKDEMAAVNKDGL